MSRPLAATLLALLTCGAATADASDYAFSWSLPHPQGNGLNSVVFEADDLTGYAVGDHGAVVVTTDGGVSWSNRGVLGEFTTDLEDLLLLGPGDLLAVGELPGIFRSQDGGATWAPTTNPSSGRLRDVARVNGSNLCALGDAGRLLRSTDDGATWSVGASPKSEDLYDQLWIDANVGYVLGFECCRRTTNGGASWSTLPGVSEGSIETFNEVFATDPSNITIHADFHTARTTNGGASWSYEFAPNELNYHATTVSLSPQHRLVSTVLEGSAIYETTDDGESWTNLLEDFEAQGLRDFISLGDGTLIAISSEGDLYRSADVGQTWVNATRSPDDEPRVTIATLALAPNGHAFAGSTQPGDPIRRFHKSADGGDTWVETPDPAINFMKALGLTPGGVLLAGGGGSTGQNRIWRSTDEAATWTFHTLPNSFPNGVQATDIEVVNASTAYASSFGSNAGTVFWTTDAGLTWTQRSTGIPSNVGLWAIDFIDEQNGFTAGGTSALPRIYRTTNAGANWSSVGTSGLGDFVFDTHWFDAQTGLATNAAQAPGIYRTTNGGANWVEVWPDFARNLSFADAQRGYCTPNDLSFSQPMLLETIDGGASWSPIPLPMTYGLESVLALEDGFLGGGHRSTILRGRIVGAVGVDEVDEVDEAVSRDQVLLVAQSSVGPRPALEFALPVEGPASLAIYDVHGRRLRMLADGEFTAGERVSRTWDGTDGRGVRAPDGVYFARLRTDERVVAVKIVLRH